MAQRPRSETSGPPERAAPDTSRVLGVYPQKQSGRFMQRIKIFGGRINWRQWRRVADLAATYSAGFPLHLTTRQDIELHDIGQADVATVQQGLAEVALTTFGACGDSVRNITVCPGCEFGPDGGDLMPVAQLVRHCLEQRQIIFTLPRKFKISFSGCPEACAKPWLNDLGFVGQPDERFTVIGAGSLGAKPALGIELYRNMPAEDIAPLCVAAVELFHEEGDRDNRRRARLRHIRERLGDDEFKARLHGRFERVRARESWPLIRPGRASSDVTLQHRLQLPDGNITPAGTIQLADVAEPYGAILRLNLEHGLNLYGPEPIALPKELAAMTKAPVIVACPGCATCPQGLADCWATAAQIRAALATTDCSNVRINISGCPNNCAHSAAGQIGLIGLLRKDAGQTVPHYRVLTGGGNGANNILAEPHSVVPADKISETIKELLP